MGERKEGRNAGQLRPLRFVPGYQVHPAASVLACFGRTRVICSVSVTEGVPRWMHEQQERVVKADRRQPRGRKS